MAHLRTCSTDKVRGLSDVDLPVVEYLRSEKQ